MKTKTKKIVAALFILVCPLCQNKVKADWYQKFRLISPIHLSFLGNAGVLVTQNYPVF